MKSFCLIKFHLENDYNWIMKYISLTKMGHFTSSIVAFETCFLLLVQDEKNMFSYITYPNLKLRTLKAGARFYRGPLRCISHQRRWGEPDRPRVPWCSRSIGRSPSCSRASGGRSARPPGPWSWWPPAATCFRPWRGTRGRCPATRSRTCRVPRPGTIWPEMNQSSIHLVSWIVSFDS